MNGITPYTVFPRGRRYSGYWIWGKENRTARNTRCLFRRIFTLEEPPDKGMDLFITACSRYRLYVNDVLVGDGPPVGSAAHAYIDRRPVGHLLMAGQNILAALVHYVGFGDSAGFYCELGGPESPLVVTDADWKALAPAAWREDSHYFSMNSYMPAQEHCDGRRLPKGWESIEFDDRDWPAALVIRPDNPPYSGPWSLMYERDIPFPEETALLPERIVSVEECRNIKNRNRPQDLSITLSQAGRPVEKVRIENAEHLLRGADGCVLAGSDDHLRGFYDGMHDPCLLFDFGRIVTALIEIDVTAPEGAAFEVGYAERLIDGRFNNAVETQQADGYICREGKQVFRFQHWRAFRFLKLRLRDCPASLKLHALRAIRVRYPFMEQGGFTGDDATLQGVFNISRETIRLCAVEHLMDTPWREGAQWLGDISAVTLGGIYACFGDTAMPAKFLRHCMAASLTNGLLRNENQRPTGGYDDRVIPDYSLWWILGLAGHYRYTGEEAWIHAGYPYVLRILQWFLHFLDDQGMLEQIPHWIFIDWAPVDKRGSSAILNALFAAALDEARAMAGLTGDPDGSRWMKQTADTIRAGYTRRFFDPERGCFADAWKEGRRSSSISEHANAAALRWNCCSADLAPGVIQSIFEREAEAPANAKVHECQPFFMVVVLEALRLHGRMDLALRLIRDRWGKRMLACGATSTYEEWMCNGTFRSGTWEGIIRSQSHAWSACPAEFLIRQIAGIGILEPGCRRMLVAPQKVGFAYEARFPTPLGNLIVKHRNGTFTITAPKDMEVEKRLP